MARPSATVAGRATASPSKLKPVPLILVFSLTMSATILCGCGTKTLNTKLKVDTLELIRYEAPWGDSYTLVNNTTSIVVVPAEQGSFAFTSDPQFRGTKEAMMGPHELVFIYPGHAYSYPHKYDWRHLLVVRGLTNEASALIRQAKAIEWAPNLDLQEID